MTGDRSFDDWVCQRLTQWPTPQILDFARWLDEHDAEEFVPAVREALRRRGIDPLSPIRIVKEPAA